MKGKNQIKLLGASVLSRENSATIPSGSLLDFRLVQSFSG